MKKLFKTIALFVATLTLSTFFAGCNFTSSSEDDILTYVCMRINPEIEVIVDEDGLVVSVNAINVDGETVLSDLTLIGQTVEDAAEAFTDKATELGYIDVEAEENALYISADGTNEEVAEDIEDKVTDKVNKYFEDKGIFGKVHKETFEDLKTLATEWEVNLKEAKIIVRIQKMYPEMTIEEILALDFKEKLELVKENHKNNGIPTRLLDEYKSLVDELNLQFEELFSLEEQIKSYTEQLKDTNLTDERKAIIEGILTSLQEQLATLKEEYKLALEQIKSQIKTDLEQVNEQIQTEVNNRREQNRQKLEEHNRDFELSKDQIIEQVKNWQQNNNK